MGKLDFFHTRKPLFWLAFSFMTVLFLVLTSCGGQDTASTPSSSTPPSGTNSGTGTMGGTTPTTASTTLTVTIAEKQGPKGDQYWFEPANIVVLPGTTVVWNNMTDEDHMLTSNQAGAFSANNKVEKNGSLQMVFSTAGTTSYFSKTHPDAKGSVTVQSDPTVDVQVMEKQSAKGDVYSLNPAGLVVKTGTTVTWTNMSDEAHLLMSDTPGLFTATSKVDKNGTLKLVCSKPGTYAYASKMHPDAKGTIIVVP